ncbi:N-acetylmuramoyl-L-alanine amidase [Eubacterium sp. MSJ-13]|uniref:N-acetylmuramoyl-L-alanine amidase n=1 Tax=Eubacterium sp. MSJ-13 TaxID=2841513 RepID=UPI001C11148C|nr:N-acetylmuramoyl-L-alanine amidase [Eubacterium sp. MSJ-13]MBU5479571.1 N-acetylmuramoyl-L-alanine amidase [Eubacterium sp. MSJ-13]
MNLLKKSFIVVLCVCVVAAGGFFSRQMIRRIPVFKNSDKKTIVIDPGHGGSDPGKVGIDGSLEKDINLAISMYLKKELESKKYKVVMTREKDEGLYSEGDTNKKIADLNKRVEIMNGSDAALVVSVHQNSFTGESSKGAQVFYHSASKEGKEFAGIMQKEIAACIGDGNNRVEKANSDYYILRKSVPTAVIVECGFLSNSQEAALLSDSGYQKKMAGAIAKGVYEYIQKEAH